MNGWCGSVSREVQRSINLYGERETPRRPSSKVRERLEPNSTLIVNPYESASPGPGRGRASAAVAAIARWWSSGVPCKICALNSSVFALHLVLSLSLVVNEARSLQAA